MDTISVHEWVHAPLTNLLLQYRGSRGLWTLNKICRPCKKSHPHVSSLIGLLMLKLKWLTNCLVAQSHSVHEKTSAEMIKYDKLNHWWLMIIDDGRKQHSSHSNSFAHELIIQYQALVLSGTSIANSGHETKKAIWETPSNQHSPAKIESCIHYTEIKCDWLVLISLQNEAAYY